MLKKKRAGVPAPREHAAPRPQNVVNLMDALRRSIAEGKRSTSPSEKGRKRIAGQTKMLLPIPGEKAKEAAVKSLLLAPERDKRRRADYYRNRAKPEC